MKRFRIFKRGEKAEEEVVEAEVEEAVEEKPKAKVFKDFYEVSPPFGFVGLEAEEGGKLRYTVVEPPLSPSEVEVIQRIKDILLEEVDLPPSMLRDREAVEEIIKERVRRAIEIYKLDVAEDKLEKIYYYMLRDFLGYGKIDIIMRDPQIEDVSVDGVGIPIFVWHKFYENLPTNLVFDRDELEATISRLAYKTGYQITLSQPILDGILPEGFRIHIALSEVSKRGGSFTIRKFSEKPFTIVDLISFGTMSPEIAAYLWIQIENLRSVMVGGATAAGKTTCLNSVSMLIHPEAKIVTIEETQEIRLPHENWVPMVTRQIFGEEVREITLFELLKSALRQRPEYVIVGEVRGAEAYTLFQSISTGHGGLCTIHADNIATAVKRLITEPMNVPLMLIPLMNVGCMVNRVKVGGNVTRRITEVKEIKAIDESVGTVEFHSVFDWTGEERDTYTFSGQSVVFEQLARARYLPVESLYREMDDRTRVMKWMVKRNLKSYLEVAEAVRLFYHDREKMMNRVRLG